MSVHLFKVGELVVSWPQYYTPWDIKTWHFTFVHIFTKYWPIFKFFYTDTFCGQFAIIWLLHIPPRRKCVSRLPCEMFMKYALITIITNKHFQEHPQSFGWNTSPIIHLLITYHSSVMFDVIWRSSVTTSSDHIVFATCTSLVHSRNKCRIQWRVIPRFHDQANIEQLEHTSWTCILNTFVWCLLDRVNGFLYTTMMFLLLLHVCVTRLHGAFISLSARKQPFPKLRQPRQI